MDLIETQEKLKLFYLFMSYKVIIIHLKKEFLKENNRTINVQFTELNSNLQSFSVQGFKLPFHKRVWYKIKNIFRKD